MSPALGTLALALLAGLAFAAGAWLAAELAWPLLRRALRHRHPATRARAALAVAVAPGAVPALLLALCFAPGLLGALGLHADHCVRHPGHPHLCLAHPTALLTPALATLLASGVGLVALGSLVPARRAARARRARARLRAGSTRSLAADVRCVESDRPFSFTAGLGRGEIFVSAALVEALAPERLEVVIEHERAHARRRDGLRRLLARTLSGPLRPRLRREILAELEIATERACDEAAACRVGDRLRVAETILAVERLLSASPSPAPAGSLAFGGSSVPARVRALLDEPPGAAGRSSAWAAAALAVGACALADPLHHATEHLLGLLLGAP